MNQITTSMVGYFGATPSSSTYSSAERAVSEKRLSPEPRRSGKPGREKGPCWLPPIQCTACRASWTKSVFGPPTAVVDNLWAYEIDTKDTIERSKKEIREKIQWFLKFADISTKADDFVESATMNPVFEESAMFENMADLMLKDEYEIYVFDTAPTANARRLLGMSKVYSLWVDKMLKSREEARSLRELLSFSKKKEADPLLAYLLQFRQRMGQARQRLTDVERTAFFFVTLPEALPIAVISRFIGWFQEFGIPVGGVIVNMLLDKAAMGPDVPAFVRNRVAMQEEYMKSIWEKFDGSVRALVPLFDQEVRGRRMLYEAAQKLMS